MKKISLAAVTAVLAAIETVFNSAVNIKNSVASLGWKARDILKVFAGLVLLTALGFASWKAWEHFRPTPAVEAPVAEVLKQEETVTVTAPVKHYAASTKAKLRLPQAVQASSAHVVLTATDLPKSKHERTVSSVLDTTTGEVKQYIEEKPLPWVESTRSGSASVYTGFKGIEPAIRAELKQDIYSVKGVNIGAVVSVDQTASGRTDTFVGIGARYEW